MASQPNKRKILIVDDHPFLREGLAQFINKQSDLMCCGEAESEAHAHTAIETYKPDLVLLDLRLGNNDGLEFIKVLKAIHPDLRILILSQHDESIYAERALAAGANGYIMKQEATNEVLCAIRTVLDGELYVSRKMSARVLQKMLENRREMSRSGVERLSDRELQVLQLLGSKMSTKEIAASLKLSGKTVETYRENLKNKLGLQNSAELIKYAEDWLKQQ